MLYPARIEPDGDGFKVSFPDIPEALTGGATWEEAVAEYKSYLGDYRRNPNYRGMGSFRKLYRRIKR